MTTENTPLDQAHAAMSATPEDDAARLGFYERLADAELFLLLLEEPSGDNIAPQVFNVQDHSFVVAFDREARLAEFVGETVPYAAMSGRILALLLSEQNLGLGLNLEVAPSAMLIPPDAVVWLSRTLGQSPDMVEERAEEIRAPSGLPEVLITALDAKLATATGMARSAYLVGVRYEGGRRGHILAFVDAIPQAQEALTQAVNEALIFSGIEAGTLDVGFFRASDPMSAHLARKGLRFDIAQRSDPESRKAPGSDPQKPPILK